MKWGDHVKLKHIEFQRVVFNTEMYHLNGILFVDRVTSKDDLNKELIKEGFNEKDVISIN